MSNLLIRENFEASEFVSYIFENIYLYKNRDDEERLWIPAKSDLNIPSLYPRERYYTEIAPMKTTD